jgi:hypothetical protein
MAQQNPLPAGLPQQPIRIEISQTAVPHPSWEKWISLVEWIAWPMVAIIGLFLLRKPISNFLDVLGKRANEFSIGGLGIKLTTMNEAQLGDDVLTFRAADTFMFKSPTARRSLIRIFTQPGKYEFVAVNLGIGDKWLSSRLYIFAIMMQRMKALRCMVFLCAGDDTENQFIGAITPEKVRWGLAKLQPWLEKAYEKAYAETIESGMAKPFSVLNGNGAIDAEVAEEILSKFVTNLTIRPTEKDDREWVSLGPNNLPEHATWLSREYLRQNLDYAFWTDVIVVSETKKEAKALLKCSAPYVAKIKKDGNFLSLIDRVAFLDEVIGKISDKLEKKD